MDVITGRSALITAPAGGEPCRVMSGGRNGGRLHVGEPDGGDPPGLCERVRVRRAVRTRTRDNCRYHGSGAECYRGSDAADSAGFSRPTPRRPPMVTRRPGNYRGSMERILPPARGVSNRIKPGEAFPRERSAGTALRSELSRVVPELSRVVPGAPRDCRRRPPIPRLKPHGRPTWRFRRA
jgi:hypothetical protein